MKTILFYENSLNLRGTSVALYDYAYYNQKILGNKSIIVSPKNSELISLDKFKSEFETYLIDNIHEINEIPHDYFYAIKYGIKDNIVSDIAKNCIHVVFPSYDPHGDVYAYVSSWLAKTHGHDSPYVPHMVNLPSTTLNFRNHFNADDKFVFGWYGGNNFEIEFVREIVVKVAKNRKDVLFLFMNQDSFCNEPNVLFIEGTYDLEQKAAFINTCDAMIHARYRGETFGLAIAEFSSKNKPIITYHNSPERNHIETLKDMGLYYTNKIDLEDILMNISKNNIENKNWNCYQDYTPAIVMKQFENIFLC
jgi:glycosyltransferase involved in cell wall biosynthesis